jgi:predicted kinase
MGDLFDEPAAARLRWFLARLAEGGADRAEVEANIAPSMLEHVAVDAWSGHIDGGRAMLHPFEVAAVERIAGGARARVVHDGASWLISCRVEAEEPHRVSALWVLPTVPPNLTPRLPMTFADHGADSASPGAGQALVVFAGLPGVGKSTLADAVGRELRAPVFAIDWLLGALTPFGGRMFDDLWAIGLEQMTTLAFRQLTAGQSVVLDAPGEELDVRERWQSLASSLGAAFRPFVCVCPDVEVHKARFEGRRRGIPGWHETGAWSNVLARIATFEPWPAATTIDCTTDLSAAVEAALERITR